MSDISRVIDYLITAKNLSPQKIEAFSRVITALGTSHEVVSEPNQLPETPAQENSFEPPIFDISEVEKVQVDEQEEKNVNLYAS